MIKKNKDSRWVMVIFIAVIHFCQLSLFPLITSMYVARILLAEGVGKVAYGQNVSSYFVLLATMGLPEYGIREIAKVRRDNEDCNKIFTELLIINAIFTIASTLAYGILVFAIPKFREDIVLFLFCGIQIVLNLFNIDWFYQGIEEYVYISIRSITVKALAFVAVLLIVRNRDDYIWYALIQSLAVTVNYFLNMIYSRKYVRFDFSNIELRRHMSHVVILAFSIFFAVAFWKIDITMLGTISTEAATGIYSNAHKITDIVIVLCTSISTVFMPRLSYSYMSDKKEFYRLLEIGIKILSFITFPIVIGMFVLAPYIMTVLFGDEFSIGFLTVRIFTILIIVKSFGNLLCYQLVIATGNEKKRIPAYAAAAVVNVILNAILIPKMAQNGAAIASVISEFVVNGYQIYAMRRLFNFSLPKKSIF